MSEQTVKHESHKNFTLTIYESEWNRQMRYSVNGFWSEPVSLLQIRSCDDTSKWDKPSISWSSGGVEKGTDPGDVIEAFTDALSHARKIYLEWKEEAK